MNVDEPWQTLACCMEIANASRSHDPTQFISHFPVHQVQNTVHIHVFLFVCVCGCDCVIERIGRIALNAINAIINAICVIERGTSQSQPT